MTYWLVGEEEHDDPRFTTCSLGLYVRAGSWCMGHVRYRRESEIPVEWFIPVTLVKAWGATRQANELVRQGVLEPVIGGWRFAWIRPENTTDRVRAKRKRERDKKAPKPPIPQGKYMGEFDAKPPHDVKPAPRSKNQGYAQ